MNNNLSNDPTNESNLIASYSYDRIVLPETVMPNFHYDTDQLTKNNNDYSDRPQCHFTTTINPQLNWITIWGGRKMDNLHSSNQNL